MEYKGRKTCKIREEELMEKVERIGEINERLKNAFVYSLALEHQNIEKDEGGKK